MTMTLTMTFSISKKGENFPLCHNTLPLPFPHFPSSPFLTLSTCHRHHAFLLCLLLPTHHTPAHTLPLPYTPTALPTLPPPTLCPLPTHTLSSPGTGWWTGYDILLDLGEGRSWKAGGRLVGHCGPFRPDNSEQALCGWWADGGQTMPDRTRHEEADWWW